MSKVLSLWRHPIKGFGRESVESTIFQAGLSMPWDRVWAVAHDAAKAERGVWANCANFARSGKAPALMAVTASLDETSETITLRHPDRPDLTFSPDTQPEALIEWTRPLVSQDRALPSHILRLDGRGYTDTPYPSVSLCNMASHRAVEAQLDQELSIHRWRGNIWMDGFDAWDETTWTGKTIRIGGCVFLAKELATRCMSTTSNPTTGKRDADTLGALDHFGHQEFSMLAEVIETGPVAVGDQVEVL
jgi:uncharacterized protein YcbX